MTQFSPTSRSSGYVARAADTRASIAVLWHGVWVLLVIAVAAGLLVADGDLPFRRSLALTLGALPGVLGALWGRGASRRPLLVIWAIGAGLAVGFGGGLTGPLLLWSALPLVVAAVLGGLWGEGVLLSLALLAVVAVVQFAGGISDDNSLWTALLASAAALASAGAWVTLSGNRAAEAATLDWAPGSTHGEGAALPSVAPQSKGAPPSAAPGDDASDAPRARSEPAPAAAAPTPPEPPPRGSQPAAMSEERLRRIEQAEKGLREQLRATMAARADAEAERDSALIQRDEAEANARARLRFLANMSHELRTPLNAIMGFSDIMRARLFGEMAPKYGEYAQLIHESGGHVLDLINDLLDMARIESDKYELRREIFDVREAINAALRILRVQADDAGVQLRAELPGEEVAVDADPRAIKQIVLNLISNSLKFTPRGGSVLLSANARADELELVVADTGSGIGPDDLQRIGRPFEQAGDVKDRQRGTGLGLSLVKAFAGLHGGQMVIESILGEGTVVRVGLPVLYADPASSEPAGLHGRPE